jgi:hypothetical protein
VVYPTLASDHINLSLLNLNSRQTAQIVISNLAGQVVWRESVRAFQQQPVEIDVQSLPAGIYLAAAMVEGRRVGVKKFVVTHP